MSAITAPATRTSPYQGLTSYAARDRAFFFGREHETRIIVANLLATRLTLVYGASGVGKSSLMCAGVMPRLRELAEEGIRAGRGPGCVAAVFPAEASEDDLRRASWQDDPIEGIANAIEDAVAGLGLDVEPPERTGDLTQLLADWTERLEADVLLVLDQFEEYFVYHGDEDGDGTLAAELPRALSETSLPANVVISIREDAYTRLDRFKGRLSILYDNYLRVDHLSREGAREAIVRPLEEYRKLGPGDMPAVTIEDDLVDEVLEQVQSGAVSLGQSGRGSVGNSGGGGIETPFLQLVMERLWSAERAAGSDVLRLQTLERLGGARPIVRAHLDDAMATLDAADQDVCARVFGRLVTPSRTKIAYLAADLAEQEGLDPDRLTPVLEDLAAKRILRPVSPPPDAVLPRYEIFHDVLAPAVLDWRARWVQAQEHVEAERALKTDLERQERERRDAQAQARHEARLAGRRRRIAAVAIVLAVLAGVLAVRASHAERSALAEQKRAQRANDAERAGRRVLRAIRSAAKDPASALGAATVAVRAPDNPAKPQSVQALRDAVRTAALVAVMHRGEAVRAASFSPDGKTLLTVAGASLDLWDAHTGHHLAGVRARRGAQLLDAAFSPDGKTLVVGASDRRVLLWRPPARQLEPLGGTGGRVLRVAFSPRGDRVLAASDGDTALRIWSLADPQSRRVFRRLSGTPTQATFSPDGRHVLTASVDGTAAIWSARTGDLERLLDDAPRLLRAAQFSPDGRIVVTGSDNSDAAGTKVGTAFARVWDVATGRRGAYIRTHAAITSVAFTRDGGHVVVGTADGSAQIWRPSHRHAEARVLLTLRGQTDQVSRVAFSPGDHWVLTASGDGTTRVWNAATGTLLAELGGHEEWVGTAEFGADGTRIVTASDDGTARLWRLPIEQPAVRLGRGIADNTRVFFDRAGAHALFVTPGHSARLADARTGRPLMTFDRGRVAYAMLSSDGTRVLTANAMHIATWDAQTGERLALTEFEHIRAWPGAFMSGDQRRIAFGVGSRVRMWDVRTGRLSRPFVQPRGAESLASLAINQDGSRVAASRFDGTVTVWDSTTGRVLRTLRPGLQLSLALSPDGSVLLGKRRSLSLRLALRPNTPWLTRTATATTAWSTRTGQRLLVLRSHDSADVQRFSPDGRLIVTAGAENSARVWDARTGRKLAVLRGHTGPLDTARFSADSRLLVTASDDGTARVWNPRTGELYAELAQGAAGAAWTAAFTPADDVVVGSKGRVAIYRCRACGSVTELLGQADRLKPHSYR